MADIDLSFGDYLEIDYVRNRSNSTSVEITSDKSYEGYQVQTKKYIFKPQEYGEYTIKYNGESVTVSVGNISDGTTVSRTKDNLTSSESIRRGIRFKSTVKWSEIGAKLSQNYGGNASLAQVYDLSSGSKVAETSISGLNRGDIFTISGPFSADQKYQFVIYDNGNSFTNGYNGSTSFPKTSADGKLSITGGARRKTTSANDPSSIVKIGDIGF